MTSFASKADARAQVMLLAREGSRLDLYTDDGLHQEVVILPRRIDDQGFTVATLLPIPRDLPIWSAGETIRLRAAPFGAQLTLWCPLQDWVRVRDEWQLRLGWPGKWLDEERREALRIIVPTTHEAASIAGTRTGWAASAIATRTSAWAWRSGTKRTPFSRSGSSD